MTIVFQGEIEKKNAYAKLLGLVKKGVFFYMYFPQEITLLYYYYYSFEQTSQL